MKKPFKKISTGNCISSLGMIAESNFLWRTLFLLNILFMLDFFISETTYFISVLVRFGFAITTHLLDKKYYCAAKAESIALRKNSEDIKKLFRYLFWKEVFLISSSLCSVINFVTESYDDLYNLDHTKLKM